MTSKEFETVAYPKLKHVRAFVNNILYRNYHLHGETEFLCVLGGECKVNKAGKSIEAKKGSVVLINPHESHEIVGASEGTDFIVIQLSRHILREYFPLMQTSFFSETDLNAAFGGETDRLWRQILVLTDSYIRAQSGFELRCVAAAAGILSLLYDNVPHTACSEVEYLDRKSGGSNGTYRVVHRRKLQIRHYPFRPCARRKSDADLPVAFFRRPFRNYVP